MNVRGAMCLPRHTIQINCGEYTTDGAGTGERA
jgi:hypothetical protein